MNMILKMEVTDGIHSANGEMLLDKIEEIKATHNFDMLSESVALLVEDVMAAQKNNKE